MERRQASIDFRGPKAQLRSAVRKRRLSGSESRRSGASSRRGPTMSDYLFNDSHIHLTNYVQDGPDIKDYLSMMGDTVKRSVLFGLPVQQMWSHAEMGDVAPSYYMQSDASLYYYSFTDAYWRCSSDLSTRPGRPASIR
jgi:hypothetical protein